MTHCFHPSIVREYDMRGVVGETLHEADAYALGRAFADWVPGTIIVACDGRVSSPVLKAKLIEGLRAQGAHVIDIGMGPTPMLYFAAKALDAEGGIMVTGSHNPGHHNGFKMTRREGSVYGDQIKALAARAARMNEFTTSQGALETRDIKDEYLKALRTKSETAPPKRQTIVWDCGNGAVGAVLPDLLRDMPGEHVVLFAEVDGTFPNHHPDPTVEENLVAMKQTVKDRKAAVGLAFDGDGDRLGVVDERGHFVAMDDLIALLASDVLATHPGKPIIADVKCGPHLFSEITRQGGEAIMWRTGHSPIKAKMVESGAPFAGEYSGHLFFADRYYGFDDGLYAALRVLDILARTDKTLSQLLRHLPKRVGPPEARFAVPDDQKFSIVERFAALIQAHPHFPKNGHVITIDGIRVETPDGWLLLRASNTEGKLVLRLEAKDEPSLAALQALVKDVFKQLSYAEIADKIAA